LAELEIVFSALLPATEAEVVTLDKVPCVLLAAVLLLAVRPRNGDTRVLVLSTAVEALIVGSVGSASKGGH